MASQTKVEPQEEASAFAATSHVRRAEGEAIGREEREVGGQPPEDSAAPPSDIGDGELLADDEDVSLDELLISDDADDASADDEPEDATEVHTALPRLDLASPEDPSSPELEKPAAAAPEALAADLHSDPAAAPESLSASPADSPASSVSSSFTAEPATAQEKRSEEEREGTEAYPVLLSDLDESPEQAAARAAADQEAMAARAAAEREAAAERDTERGLETTQERAEPTDVDAALEAFRPEQGQEPSTGEATPPALAEADEADEAPDMDAESVRAEDLDPLPSFDIPEVEAGGARRSESLVAASERAAQIRPPPSEAASMAAFAPLSELAEDDDDAVTHIGLPVPDGGNDYAALQPAAFESAEPAIAALQGFDSALSKVDARRAATRIIPRIDPSRLPPRSELPERSADTMRPLAASLAPPAIGAWLSRLISRTPSRGGQPGERDVRRWVDRKWIDKAAPYVSMALLGSGIGAVIVMLAQPGSDNRGTAAAEPPSLSSEAAGTTTNHPATLLERARAGEGDALFKITSMAPRERTSALTLALESGYRAQKLNDFREFATSLPSAPNSVSANVAERMIDYATSSETLLAAFELLSTWPGPVGPDLLYAIWETAPGGSRASVLAHQLLQASDQRAKASAALMTALDLRGAKTCEDYLRVLPAVVRSGDQRSSPTLRALKHTDGCGDDGQQDCYSCLREGAALDEALAAVEKRPAPGL